MSPRFCYVSPPFNHDWERISSKSRKKSKQTNIGNVQKCTLTCLGLAGVCCWWGLVQTPVLGHPSPSSPNPPPPRVCPNKYMHTQRVACLAHLLSDQTHAFQNKKLQPHRSNDSSNVSFSKDVWEVLRRKVEGTVLGLGTDSTASTISMMKNLQSDNDKTILIT